LRVSLKLQEKKLLMRIKNLKIKNAVCVFLCVLLLCQTMIFAVSAADEDINIIDIDEIPVIRIHPDLDEIIDLYVKYSLYDITREEAIDLMIQNLLVDHPGLLPYLGDALLSAHDNYGRYIDASNPGGGGASGNIFHGYGIRLAGTPGSNGHLYNTRITQVFPDSPADRAGLRAGDEFIKIGDISVENLGLIAVSHLLSYSGNIELVMRRNGEYITIPVNKALVFSSSVSFEMTEDGDTAVITILDFNDLDIVYDLYDLFEKLKDGGIENLIIDLRGNPGGYIEAMLGCLNLFVTDKGVDIVTLVYKDGEPETLQSTGIGFAFDKICVLVDRQTASASEFLALALSELAGAAVIGEKTPGKAVGQNYFMLSNGDVAVFTMLRVLSAMGTDYNNIGVKPDIVISPVFVTVERPVFGQLNFVNSRTISKDADNNAVLALNQRLAAMGYILPEDITSKCTVDTINAVGIFQKINKLSVGIDKIDYLFL